MVKAGQHGSQGALTLPTNSSPEGSPPRESPHSVSKFQKEKNFNDQVIKIFRIAPGTPHHIDWGMPLTAVYLAGATPQELLC